MTVERKNPIPAGRYWVDPVGEAAKQQFDDWVDAHSKTVAVESDHSEPTHTKPWLSFFVIFTVSAPTPRWDPVQGLGAFPNVAPASVQTKADAMKVPEAPGVVETLKEGLESALSEVGTVLLLAVVAFMLFNKRR